MAGSIYGEMFRITTWGESHGPGIGVVIDGCPAGLSLEESDVQRFLDRRKPGQSQYATPRKEADQVQFLSGLFEGKTTGAPITMAIMNTNQRPMDYSFLSQIYRPGHADLTYDLKYGFRDYRGGGRSSGRETTGRVAAGAVASKLLHELGITIQAYTKSIHNIVIAEEDYQFSEIFDNPFYMPSNAKAKEAAQVLENAMNQEDSVGGIIECTIHNLPAGVGQPVFDKLDAQLAKAIMSIGAVKGFEIGDGFTSALAFGSSNNDNYVSDNELINKTSNHAGGIYGGISDGSMITLRAAIKPTPSIHKTQTTVNKARMNTPININGRHDPIIVPRAVVVVEAMVAVTILDLLFQSMTSRLDAVKQFFNH